MFGQLLGSTRKKVLTGVIILGWAFLFGTSVWLLTASADGTSATIDYDFKFNATTSAAGKPAGNHFDVKIEAPLLDHDNVAYSISGYESPTSEAKVLCTGSFDNDDLYMLTQEDDSSTGIHSPAAKYFGDMAFMITMVGPKNATITPNSRMELNNSFINAVSGVPASHPISGSGFELAAAAPSASAVPMSAYTFIKPCKKLHSFKPDIIAADDSAVTTTHHHADKVAAPGFKDTTNALIIFNPKQHATALFSALIAALHSQEIVNPDACEVNLMHDDVQKAQSSSTAVTSLSWVLLVVSTLFGILFVVGALISLFKYCIGSENDFTAMVLNIEEETLYTIFLMGFALTCVIAGVLYGQVHDMLKNLKHENAFGVASCAQQVTAGTGSGFDEDTFDGILWTGFTFYAIGFLMALTEVFYPSGSK